MEQKNADGSESQVKEFTSLLGSQKKKLLNGLPSKLSEVLYSDTCETVEQIWTDFECLYNQISDFNLSKTAKLLQMPFFYRPNHRLSCFAH